MDDKLFRFWNHSIGWTVFAIALFTFGSTVEPTASFWDAGEYISTSAKLQVGHPPGAPLFQMLGAIFSIFAFDVEQIAFTVNMMSVTSSALTIIFLFWSISLITKKILGLSDVIEKNEIIEEAKNTDLYKKVLEKFSDASLINVTKKDDK